MFFVWNKNISFLQYIANKNKFVPFENQFLELPATSWIALLPTTFIKFILNFYKFRSYIVNLVNFRVTLGLSFFKLSIKLPELAVYITALTVAGCYSYQFFSEGNKF